MQAAGFVTSLFRCLPAGTTREGDDDPYAQSSRGGKQSRRIRGGVKKRRVPLPWSASRPGCARNVCGQNHHVDSSRGLEATLALIRRTRIGDSCVAQTASHSRILQPAITGVCAAFSANAHATQHATHILVRPVLQSSPRCSPAVLLRPRTVLLGLTSTSTCPTLVCVPLTAYAPYWYTITRPFRLPGHSGQQKPPTISPARPQPFFSRLFSLLFPLSSPVLLAAALYTHIGQLYFTFTTNTRHLPSSLHLSPTTRLHDNLGTRLLLSFSLSLPAVSFLFSSPRSEDPTTRQYQPRDITA